VPGEYFRRCNSVIAYRIEAINDPNNNIAWIRFFFFCLSMVNEISNCYKASAVARSHEILKSKDLFLDCYCYKGESFFPLLQWSYLYWMSWLRYGPVL